MEWTYTMSALSAAVKIFGEESKEGEEANNGIATLEEIEEFSKFARFE